MTSPQSSPVGEEDGMDYYISLWYYLEEKNISGRKSIKKSRYYTGPCIG